MAKKALATYRKKRDFSKTREPSGEVAVAASGRSRFIVQKHAARRLHYDLRLELDGVFKSWAVTRGPSDDPADKRLAVEVEDHPLDYGDFEGTIPAGEYGGGTVQLWDRGFWQPEGGKKPEEALRSGDLKFTLDGKRLHGSWVLVRMKHDRNGGKRTNWLLIKHRDADASSDHGAALLAADSSVASGRTLKQIAAGAGRAPSAFMGAASTNSRADAIWHSKDGPASKAAPAAAPAPAPPRSARQSSGTKIRKIPSFVAPQLARLVDQPTLTPGWVHEVKFDGYRLVARVADGRATLSTRSSLDWTARFGVIAQEAAALPDCMIDGEVVALDRNKIPSFSALQAALAEERSENLVYFCFDVLFVGKHDLRSLPLKERKARLEQLLNEAGLEHIRYVSHIDSRADEVLRSACKMGLEGIVSKRLDAPYTSGRADSWRKSKCRAGHEVVLGGWTTEEGTVRSLLAGVQRDGALVYVGRIGTGYGADTVRNLLPQLKALTREESPFEGADAPRKERNVRWLEPKLVAEIEFAGWTDSGMIRQAAFKGLRQDKSASDVVAELPVPTAESGDAQSARTGNSSGGGAADVKRAAAEKVVRRSATTARGKTAAGAKSARTVGGKRVAADGAATVMGVNISKPGKALWPDAGDAKPVSKLDLARFFESVGAWMLPHLEGRPCSMVRAPDGIAGQQFFQRHAMAGLSSLFDLVKVKGDKAPYVQIDRMEALAAVAQMGALELHPWNCVPNAPELAGRLVFDLDPAPDVKFDAVIIAAIEMRDRLKAVGLTSFCKTTGGKGLHVVTPLLGTRAQAVAWEPAKNFAHLICAQMANDSPTKYLDNMSKSQRVGRIFLDYLRNDRTSTAVAPLSPRARAGAPVSMPIRWRDVKPGLDGARFTVRTAPALLAKGDAWDEYEEAASSLKDAIRELTAPGKPSVPGKAGRKH